MPNKITKEVLIQFNKDAEVAIDEFVNKIRKPYEMLAKLSGKDISPVSSFVEVLSQELKDSIILTEEEMKDYLPKEVKE